MSVYSIKDLEHLSGIKAHTLRIWEQRYNIIRPKRTETNIRYYDDIDLKLVLNISLLKEHGFKISEIAQMSETAMHQEVRALTEKNERYCDQVQALTLAMIDLDEDHFEKVIATNVLKHGFEHTMMHIIYPFLIKIGILWQTGAINPAQEHFISNLIRQKLIVAIDGQVLKRREKAKKYMLFLPEGELHEISLLFANYLLRSRQNKVVYLGQSLPLHDLEAAFEVHKPDYLLTIIISTPGPEEVQAFLNTLSNKFSPTKIITSGYQVTSQQLDIPSNVILINRIEELIAFIEDQDK